MKALVVDDDRVLLDVLTFTLRREGFQVVRASDGEMALAVWAAEQPELIVLDVNLPKLDGFTVCQRIREQANTPIILLTVRDEEDDIVHGLELGADDYIAKPFSPRQLIARAQAVLRRAGKIAAPAIRQIGPLRLDPDRRELQLSQGEPILLTPLENRLLDYLMLNAGHVLTAESIIQHVWGAEGGDRDMLRQLVHRLRSKINQATSIEGAAVGETGLPRIETIPGLGYGLVAESAPTTD
jgi:DNA-binding response OmpR family regulator